MVDSTAAIGVDMAVAITVVAVMWAGDMEAVDTVGMADSVVVQSVAAVDSVAAVVAPMAAAKS
jgi:hypothetical protein